MSVKDCILIWKIIRKAQDKKIIRRELIRKKSDANNIMEPKVSMQKYEKHSIKYLYPVNLGGQHLDTHETH